MNLRKIVRHFFRLDKREAEAHRIKGEMTKDVLVDGVREINDIIYRIAQATGGKKRGL